MVGFLKRSVGPQVVNACKMSSARQKDNMDIKLIRAFIASPGGLDAERKAAFAAAEEINRTVARQLNGRLELIGWEETISGIGRPQALINADMETCDLFIGAMWASWGSRPSLDGPYTSGFEEEFELSRDRFERTRSPEMAMFFKDIDPGQLRDPGEDLRKVLAFKEKLREEKKFLYATFGTEEDFAARVREFLSAHTIRLLIERAGKATTEPTQAMPEAEAPPSPPVVGRNPSKEASFLSLASDKMETNGIDEVDIARLRLIAVTAGQEGNDTVLLGVHDANHLYVHRKDFAFSARERRGLIDTGLARIKDENTPLWTWLSAAQKEMPELLTALTIFGETLDRTGAFTAMILLEEPIRPIQFYEGDIVATKWLSSTTPNAVKIAALRYLRELGTIAELPAILSEMERADTNTLSKGREAYVAILYRHDEIAAARYLLSQSFDTFDRTLLVPVIERMSDLDTSELRAALDHRSGDIRARSLIILGDRRELDFETVARAREDDAAEVRVAAVIALEQIGQPISLDEARKIIVRAKRSAALGFFGTSEAVGKAQFDQYRHERMRRMPLAQLKALLGTPEHRDSAYMMLAARRVDDYGERLRGDLVDGFGRYFAEHWPDGISAPRMSVLALAFEPHDPAEQKRRDLAASALDVIVAMRREGDLALVRRTLDSGLVSPSEPVIAYLGNFGEEEDIPRLAKTSHGASLFRSHGRKTDVGDIAAATILKLHVGSFAELLSRDFSDQMRSRLIDTATYSEFASIGNAAATELLLTKNEALRRAAARKIPASMARKDVREILGAYKEDVEGRYYIVTHWLDLGLAYPRTVARKVTNKQIPSDGLSF